MIDRKRLLPLIALLALDACDDAPVRKELPTFDEPIVAGEDGDAGATEPARTGPQYAVINSDWQATSVSLLGVDGEVLADDYLNSGSAQAGLVSLLSGDVEMPTQSNDPGVLVLIDRYKTDVITRIRLSDAKILGQVKMHKPSDDDSQGAYTSNPHDYVRIDDQTAWVTRSQPNINPNPPELERGNDLLRINPNTMERTDERIDLSSLNTKGTRKNPDTGKEEEVEIYAKPSRMARVADTLIVGLTRNAFDFSANGTGMVAVVDLKTKAVTGLEFPDFIGCTKVSPIPKASDRVLVSCGGDYLKLRDTAGFAIVGVSKGKATVELTWRAKDHPELPALSLSSVSLGGSLIGAAEASYAPETPSVFGTLDLESSDYRELAAIEGGNTFGTPLYDDEAALLILPDSSVDGDKRPTAGLRLFKREGDDFAESALQKVSEHTTMPVRHVYPL